MGSGAEGGDSEDAATLASAPPSEVEHPGDSDEPTRVEAGGVKTSDVAKGAASTSGDVTVAKPASPKPGASVPPSQPSLQTGIGDTRASLRTGTMVSPINTFLLEETRRTRSFAAIAMPLAIVVLFVAQVIDGDPTARVVLSIGMVATGVASLLTHRLLRSEDGFPVLPVLGFAFVSVLGAMTGIYFFGPFSPAPMILPFGLYFFSLGQNLRATVAVFAACVGLYGALAIAVMTGLVVDRGLITANDLSLSGQIVTFGLVELICVATFLGARAGRRAMAHALSLHDRDLRALTQREALLKEARQELERALEAGGLGRFSDQVLGRFRLGRVLGRGGMGEVYEALKLDTNELAAVKLLHAPALSEPGFVRRFMREAQIAAKLQSPYVVRVLEIGGADATVPYLAMERLHGMDLADLLRKHRRLSVKRVRIIASQVGAGLEVARQHGIVHRDLKPRNLFLAEFPNQKPVWKILDFGVSKLGDSQGTLTQNHLVGTPSYMAPEQAAGVAIDHRADVYSLGVVCYRSLTGRPAFPGDGIPETLFKVMYAMPPAPSDSVHVHPDVDLVMAIALAKEPEHRFDSGRALADALGLAERGELDDALRARGHACVERHPWDKSLA